MGYFSYLCAVSGQSIPVPEREPTEVVAVFPDDSTYRGVWDGYGRVLPANVTWLEVAREPEVYDGEPHRIHLTIARLLGLDYQQRESFDGVERNVKLVKAKFFDRARHTWATLPASARCAAQGYFYERGAWNAPAYKRSRRVTRRG